MKKTTTNNKGYHRRRWPRELARALGWRPIKLRAAFAGDGYVPEYDADDEKGLAILKKMGVAIPTSYLAKHHLYFAKDGITTPTKDGKPIAIKPRLLTKALARLLPEGDTAKGRNRVRLILSAHGVAKPWAVDEALKAFGRAGIDTSRFSRANGNGTALVPAVSNGHLPSAPVHLAEQQAVAVLTLDDALRLKRVKHALEYNEQNIIQGIKKGAITRLSSYVLGGLDALNEMRESPTLAEKFK